MVCYHPIKGYRSKHRSSNGKFYFVTSLKDGYKDKPMTVPCGQCIGCRLERSRIWAVRCVHEASLYSENCFITLTFDDKFLNPDKTLVVRDFQLFMKRLRKAFPDRKIRYFHCGEYGELCAVCGKSRLKCTCERFVPVLGRPHHHACLFGFDFPDKYLWNVREGVKLYRSPQLEKLWGQGFTTVGDVTFESAAYVARYVVKKITGDKSINHYMTGVDKKTGEVFMRKPEYVTMSRRPGIARDWIEKYGSDVYPDDFIVIRGGVKVKPPKYYDFVYDEFLGGDIDSIKIERKINAEKRKEDNSSRRLQVREELQFLRYKKLKRGLE